MLFRELGRMRACRHGLCGRAGYSCMVRNACAVVSWELWLCFVLWDLCVCFFFAIFVYIRAFFFVCVIGVDAVFVFKKKICFLLYVQGLSNICSD